MRAVTQFITSAAIVAALGYTPASISGLVFSDGALGTPGAAFSSDPASGFYRTGVVGSSTVAVSLNSKEVVEFSWQTVLSAKDNSTVKLGYAQTTDTLGSVLYPASIITETQTLTGDSGVFMLNVGVNSLKWAGGAGTKQYDSYNFEHDKLEVSATSAGTVSMTGSVGSVFIRTPFPVSDASGGIVNIATTKGITFSRILAAAVTGTITQTVLIDLPAMNGGTDYQPTNGWFGVMGAAGYAAHIGSYDGIPLLITANALGSASGVLNLNAKNSGATVNLQYNGTTVFQIATGTGNSVQLSANSTPLFLARGSGSNVGLGIASKGTSSVSIYTNGSSTEVLRCVDTASGVNFASITPGTTGNAVTIAATGEANAPMLLKSAGTGTISVNQGSTTVLDYASTTGSTWTSTAPFNVKSTSALSLTVGRLGATTPALTVDSSAGTQVNGVKITGTATGTNARIEATANNLLFGTGSALATNATDGYIMIPTCAGAPTGVPTGAGAGKAALHYDSTNLKLYVYVAAWKSIQLV